MASRETQKIPIQYRDFRVFNLRFLDSRERRDDYNDDDYGREFSAFSTWDMRRQLVPWHELDFGLSKVYHGLRLSPGQQLKIGYLRELKCVPGVRFRVVYFVASKKRLEIIYLFVCSYIYTLWLQVLGMLLQPAPSLDWMNVQTFLTGYHGLGIAILLGLSFQISIYDIWRERNEKRHSH